ncbi:hypothetical protein Bbelb_150850 [Branchiostoma belcheri]|nr:hypothetical protein Bbelb_150850 [Branchiostoma belcheri]
MGGQSALTWFRTWRAAPRHRQEQSPYVGGKLPTSLVPMRRKAPARRVLVSGRPQQFRPMGMLLKRRTSRRDGEKGRGNPQRVLRPPFLCCRAAHMSVAGSRGINAKVTLYFS